MKNDIVTRAKEWMDTVRQWRGNNCKDAVIMEELLSEVERLTAERDQALSRAEKAEIDAEFFQSEVKLRNRIESTNDIAADLQRKYEEALSRAAAAAMEMRERAADACDHVHIICGDGPKRVIGEYQEDVQPLIRALPIDPDAQKALDQMLARARVDAIREAAAVSGHYMSDEADELLLSMWREDILALLNDGGRG